MIWMLVVFLLAGCVAPKQTEAEQPAGKPTSSPANGATMTEASPTPSSPIPDRREPSEPARPGTSAPRKTLPAGTPGTIPAPILPTPVLPKPAQPGRTPAAVDVVQQATLDLARRLQVEPQEVKLVSQVTDSLPAGDLGCPAKGQAASPLSGMVMGKILLLEAQGGQYEYRSHAGQVVYCRALGNSPTPGN